MAGGTRRGRSARGRRHHLLLGRRALGAGEGEPAAWPEELAEDDRLAAGVITFSSGDALSEQELYKHSYIGGGPIWLQGDDTESMYDEYEDDYDDYDEDDYDEDDYDEDDYDEDEDDEDYEDEDEDEDEDEEDDDGDDDDEVDAPSVFLMQFDESLVPINLGDCGIMYVFVECAWFQCH